MRGSLKRFIITLFACLFVITTGCAAGTGPSDTASPTPDETASPGPAASEAPDTEDIVSKLPLDLSDYLLETGQTEDFKAVYEAEDGILEGGTRAERSHPGYSGTGYVTNFTRPGESRVTFEVEVPGDSYYDLRFTTAAPYGEKYNTVAIDGSNIGDIYSNSSSFEQYIIKNVFLTKGRHEISVIHSWGWFLLDSLEISSGAGFDTSVFKVAPVLVNENADDVTRRLMKFLTDIYGKYIITGQYSENALMSYEFSAIKRETGRYPAMAGLDLMDYTPSRVEFGTKSQAVEAAIDWWQRGGLVTFCWHWNAPTNYLPNTQENPWWSGFYTRATNIDLAKIMNGEDQEGYDLLLNDIDAIAEQLKRLEEAGVPVLWRPLHEASGGWFWWGAKGPEPYKKLWILLYERLTYYHKLNNLIWVWNGQAADWYPGDEYVDIIGEDVYPGEKQYGSQFGRFSKALEYTSTKKIIAMTENGCLFDPDLAFKENARWAWFGTWSGEFVINNTTKAYSEQYTEKHMLKKVYSHERVLSLIDIPDIKTYPLD